MDKLLGTLPDGNSCALVSAVELEEAHQRLARQLGRETYPGELLSQLAEEWGVNRIITVRCPSVVGLVELGPGGTVRPLGPLSAEARHDLRDFQLLDQ